MHYLNRMGRRDTTVCSISNDLNILDEKTLAGGTDVLFEQTPLFRGNERRYS